MRRVLLPAASLWLALWGPVGLCFAAQAVDPFDGMQASMLRLKEELKGDLPKLQAMASKYGTKEELAAIAGERQLLRAKIQGAQDELEALGDTYRELSKTAAVQSVTVGLSELMSQAKSRKGGGSAPADAGAVIGRAMGREKIFQESNDFRRVVKSALADDEGRYQGALAQFSQRRRDTMILAAFVASLILIVSAFLYVFWRKSSALDKLITTYSTQPPQTGPARIPSMGAAGGLMLGTVLANNYRIDPASALDYAHSRKVIHRDLKPANIMITREGVVKLMDFGIAHQARLTAAKLTRAESWGTPPYMAPEQELGAVSKESDIYSLGVCLYETLTGKVPFEGPNFLAQKRERLYLRPSNVGFSTNVDIFFDKAFQPEPAKRFHSGAEMLAAFKAV